MRRLLIVYILLPFFGLGVFSQPTYKQILTTDNQKAVDKFTSDSTKSKARTITNSRLKHKKLLLDADTIALSDYMMSIERVNDNLNSIQDSIKLGFEVIGMGRKINTITNDIKLIRQNIKDKQSVVNIKNLYLYQSFASNLENENSRIQARLTKMYNRVYHAKLRLKTALSDSIFHMLYADSSLRNTFNKKLVRLDRKWNRTDSTTKANIDSLNTLKIKVADNSMSLSNMLNILDNKLDKAGQQLFGQEVNYLWQKPKAYTLVIDTSKAVLTVLDREQKAMGYYFSQTSGTRTIVLILGILLFIWLFLKRKLLRVIKEQKEKFSFLHLQYFNRHPFFTLLIILLCLMPFFDAYAPTSYIAAEYFVLLVISSFIIFKKGNQPLGFDWLALVVLFIANTLTYLLIEPTLAARLWLLVMHIGIMVFSLRFYRKLSKQMSYYRLIKTATIIGVILSGLGILFNLFGRFSLSGILGIAGIFAVTQAVVLTVFIDAIIEIVLLQLQSSRSKKGIDKPFDLSIVIKKIKIPLIIISIILWLIILTSNLNIYHSISISVVDLLTATRSIGSISFRLLSVLLFFAIIWFAHILQRLISFLFGETGAETEDTTLISKGQHSRLLITRLLVLVGGYLLAIAASGLPIDKLTFLLGALGIGIGMGLQNIVNNFVSGIILIFDGSLQIGDEIEVSGQAGKVKEIGLRASTLNTADGAEVIIPNGNILSQNIVNWTYSNDQKRVILWFSLSGKELDANIINDVINNTIKNIPNVIAQKKPVVLYTRVTPETCSITVRFWSTISNADSVKSEAMLRLSNAFATKNIGFD
jgi:small-conductance mechanosensitive channel